MEDETCEESRLAKPKDSLRYRYVIFAMRFQDFDQTLTKLVHEGKKVEPSFKFFMDTVLSPAVRDHIQEDFKLHKLKNLDAEVDIVAKGVNIGNWLNSSIEKILSQNINLKTIDAQREAYMVPRGNFRSFLQLCSKYEVPFNIVSAGIANIIASLIDHHGGFNEYANLIVYANEMLFSESGQLHGFRKPYIDSYSKNSVLEQDERQNILLMGDLIQDAFLTKYVKSRYVTSIGYLNYTPEWYDSNAIVEAFTKKYDIIFVKEAGLELPERIVRFVLDLDSEQSFFKYLDEHQYSLQEGEADLEKRMKENNLPRHSSLV